MTITGRYPLTPLQQVMLYESLRSEDPSTYVAQIRYRLSGALEIDLFRQAWASVRARHETLRSSIKSDAGGTHLFAISAPDNSAFTLADPVTSAREADGLAADDIARGFALDGEPLHRLAVIPLPDDNWEVRWSSHHIAIDGWSIPLVVSELFASYAALAGGQSPTLPPATPYSAYVDWLSRSDDTQADRHWRKVLGTVFEPTPLPTRRPATTAAGFANVTIKRVLDGDASAAIDAFCRQARVTLSTVAQAAWAAVLAAYADRDDVLFGVTTSGRPAELAGAENIVGMLITTIPHRVRIPARANVGPWLSTVQREFTRSRAHEHAGPQAIRRASGIIGQQPLFESILVVENYPTAAESAPTGYDEVLRITDASSVEQLRFPSLVTLSRTDDGRLRAELSFDTQRLDRTTAEGILSGFCDLLPTLDVDEPVRALVTRVPRSTSLPTAESAPVMPVRDRILGVLHRCRDAETLVTASGTWGATELRERADVIADALTGWSVRPGDRVAVVGARDPELIATMLACWIIGATYAPLDSSAPDERLHAMIEQLTPASIIVLDAARQAAIPGARTLPARYGTRSSDRRPVELHQGAVAYIIHTSGSSGLPKPVAISHDALSTAVAGWIGAFDLAERTHRHLHSNAPSFDVAIGEVCRALAVGATLVIAPPNAEKDVEELLDLINDEQVDVADLPPGLLRPLLQELDLRGMRLDTLDLVFIGGEQWFRTDRDELLAITSPDVRIVNAYGLSEATVDNAFALDTAPGLASDGALDLSTAYAGVRIDVRTRGMLCVPPGAAGEITLSGPTLADGYPGNPRHTALAFVPDPYADGRRLYRTGDRGIISTAGRLTVIGRQDEQIKHNGHRIEPQEIESVLQEAPAVTESCLVKRDARLVAFVTGPDQIDVADLRNTLAKRLPHHLIPQLVQADALPHTTTGKVDRRAVTALPVDFASESDTDLSTAEEHTVAAIWSAVLAAPILGPEDDFFELGGDSIAALRVIGMLKSQGWTVRVGTLMTNPILGEFARRLRRSEDDQPVNTLPTGTIVPLAPTQRLLLTNTPNPSWYDMGMAWRIGRPMPTQRVEEAIRSVIAQHPAFALRYRQTDDGWEQRIIGADKGATAVTITEVDARDILTPQTGTRTPGFRSTHSIEHDPLIHCEIRQHSDDTVLIFAVNHLIIDIYSWDVLLRGVLNTLRGLHPGAAARPGWPEYQEETAERTDRGEFDELIPRWQELVGSPEPIPRDNSDGRNVVEAVEQVEVRIPDFTTPGHTEEVVMLAALGRAYHAWSGRHLYLLLEAHGRDDQGTRVDLSAATGWFTSLTPVLFPVETTHSADRSVGIVTERLAALPSPRASIHWLAGRGRSSKLAGLPWPEISLNYLGSATQGEELQGAYELNARDWDGIDPGHRRDVLIEIEGLREGTTLVLEILYSSEVHRRETISTLADLIQTELLATQGLGTDNHTRKEA